MIPEKSFFFLTTLILGMFESLFWNSRYLKYKTGMVYAYTAQLNSHKTTALSSSLSTKIICPAGVIYHLQLTSLRLAGAGSFQKQINHKKYVSKIICTKLYWKQSALGEQKQL